MYMGFLLGTGRLRLWRTRHWNKHRWPLLHYDTIFLLLSYIKLQLINSKLREYVKSDKAACNLDWNFEVVGIIQIYFTKYQTQNKSYWFLGPWRYFLLGI